LLTVTNLQGVSEPLFGFKGLGRNRNLNGERVIRFLLFPMETNKYSYPLVIEESTIEFDGDVYRIKNVKRRSKGRTSYKEVVAIHDFFADLIDSHKYELFTGSMTFAASLNFIFDGTGYTYSVVDSFLAEQFENFGDDNRVALFQEILSRYEAEYTRTDKHLTFKKQIGIDTDVQFRYNHNVKAVSEEVDTKNLSTYIRGYGKDGLEVIYTSPNVDIFGIRHAPPVRDERYTTESGLLARLESEIQDIPNMSITIDLADLRRAGYLYEVANEGDRIFLIYEPLNIDTEARIMEIDEEYNEKLEVVKTDVTLANFKDSIIEKLAGFSQAQKNLKGILDGSKPLPYNVMPEAIKKASEALTSAQTELEFEQGIIARDPTNPNRLVLFNSAGLGVSLDGGMTFEEAITYLGINTNLLTAGQIKTNNIQIIGQDGQFYWDGNALWAIDSSDPNKYVRLNKDGLYIARGAATIERPDGYKVINNGMANFDLNIQGGTPQYIDETKYGDGTYVVNTEGPYIRTASTAYVRFDYFRLRHTSRYAHFAFYAKGGGAGAYAYVRIIDNLGNTLATNMTNSTSDANIGVTIDMGVPTGQEKLFYAEIKSTSTDNPCRVRLATKYMTG
jgi:phage minor structural protein